MKTCGYKCLREGFITPVAGCTLLQKYTAVRWHPLPPPRWPVAVKIRDAWSDFTEFDFNSRFNQAWRRE